MRRHAHIFTLTFLIFGLWLSGTNATLSDTYLTWQDKLEDLFTPMAGRWDYPAAQLARQICILSGAMYDSLVVVRGGDPRPLLVTEGQIIDLLANFSSQSIDTASHLVAVSAAARDVMLWLYPQNETQIMEVFQANVPSGYDPAVHQAAVAVGEAVASRYAQLREDDGFEAVRHPEPHNELGSWKPTPPQFRNFTNVGIASAAPFGLVAVDSFQAEAPPALSSSEYRVSFDDIKSKGALESLSRTQDETDVVSFWNIEDVSLRWLHLARKLVSLKPPPSRISEANREIEELRLFTMMTVAATDALIVNFDSKLKYFTWRPVTAIRDAANDGNSGTTADPNWMPLRNSDASPEYPSATAAICGAVGKLLINYYGSNVALSDIPVPYCHFTQTTGACTAGSRLSTESRKYGTIQDMIEECARSRTLAGVHFSFSTRKGVDQSYAVADWLFTNKFSVGAATPVAPPSAHMESYAEMTALIVMVIILAVALIGSIAFVVWRRRNLSPAVIV